jgi:hypothetical protein
MYLHIHIFEIADGLKGALIHADFNITSVLKSGPGEIALILGIDLYVAQIICHAANKAVKFNSFTQTTRQ